MDTDIKIPLAVANSDFNKSPLYVLEMAACGKIQIFFKGKYRLLNENGEPASDWTSADLPVNVKPILRLIKEDGLDAVLNYPLDCHYELSSKIFGVGFPIDNCERVLPCWLRVTEELYVRLSDIAPMIRPEQSAREARQVGVFARYEVPENGDWPKFSLIFYGGETGTDEDYVKLKYKGMAERRFRYSDLGFADRRRQGYSNRLWRCLIELAKNGGESPVNKADAKELRARLKQITGLSGNPIVNVSRTNKYRAAFLISYRVRED